ncbi:cell wall-associated NlpC family hydrolase [Paenibacillus sp. BK033]|nr:cell wall-associated NlpC family hydrolase [Paenibacillus sp. BK033]
MNFQAKGNHTTMKNTFKSLKKLMTFSLVATIAASAFTLATTTNHANAATEKTLALISEGKNYLGVPYKYGAPVGITYAFDCSSFTKFMFAGLDVNLPRTAAEQATVGKKVPKTELSTGDLVFFRTNGISISHVAIYAGSKKILHSSTSQGVTVSDMTSSYWSNKYVTARRVVN